MNVEWKQWFIDKILPAVILSVFSAIGVAYHIHGQLQKVQREVRNISSDINNVQRKLNRTAKAARQLQGKMSVVMSHVNFGNEEGKGGFLDDRFKHHGWGYASISTLETWADRKVHSDHNRHPYRHKHSSPSEVIWHDRKRAYPRPERSISR